MAENKKVANTKPEEVLIRYTKQQFVDSSNYRDRRDLIYAVLEDGKDYTPEEVESKIRDFMKGKVE